MHKVTYACKPLLFVTMSQKIDLLTSETGFWQIKEMGKKTKEDNTQSYFSFFQYLQNYVFMEEQSEKHRNKCAFWNLNISKH